MKLRPHITIITAIVLLATSFAWAGHHCKGHGSMMPSWRMNALDANQDKTLSFEEYSAHQTKKLRAGFDMIDSNNDGVVSEDEWKTFLYVHGVETK